MKKEFIACFQITRKVLFEVDYYTLESNNSAYFTTSASVFNQPKTDYCVAGQCQEHELPENSKAMEFYKKWDCKHLRDLTDDEYEDMRKDLEELFDTYNYLYKELDEMNRPYNPYFSFYQEKELSMKKVKKINK